MRVKTFLLKYIALIQVIIYISLTLVTLTTRTFGYYTTLIGILTLNCAFLWYVIHEFNMKVHYK